MFLMSVCHSGIVQLLKKFQIVVCLGFWIFRDQMLNSSDNVLDADTVLMVTFNFSCNEWVNHYSPELSTPILLPQPHLFPGCKGPMEGCSSGWSPCDIAYETHVQT